MNDMNDQLRFSDGSEGNAGTSEPEKTDSQEVQESEETVSSEETLESDETTQHEQAPETDETTDTGEDSGEDQELEPAAPEPEPKPAEPEPSRDIDTAPETREVLTNPFQIGEAVVIPAGTTYTTTNPAIKGRQKTKRAQTVIVDDAFPAFLVRTKSNRVMVRPLRIRTTGSGGYLKDINITEMVVLFNGKTPHYQPVPVDV